MSSQVEIPAATYTATEIANLYAAKTGISLHPAEICATADRLGLPRRISNGRSRFLGEVARQLLAALPIARGSLRGPPPGGG